LPLEDSSNASENVWYYANVLIYKKLCFSLKTRVFLTDNRFGSKYWSYERAVVKIFHNKMVRIFNCHWWTFELVFLC